MRKINAEMALLDILLDQLQSTSPATDCMQFMSTSETTNNMYQPINNKFLPENDNEYATPMDDETDNYDDDVLLVLVIVMAMMCEIMNQRSSNSKTITTTTAATAHHTTASHKWPTLEL
ncbi:unnamed protein product, partial [Ceratitis capitata]